MYTATYHSEVHPLLLHYALQVIQNPGIALSAQCAQYQAKLRCLLSCLDCLSASLTHAFVVIMLLCQHTSIWVIPATRKF